MERGSIWMAGVCGLVGLFAGRASAPAEPIAIQAMPVAKVAAAPLAPARVDRFEPATEEDDEPGTDPAAVLASLHDAAALPREGHAIVGRITDGASNEPAIGATVVATGPNLVGEDVVITNDTGAFEVFDLPVGYYRLTIYWNEQVTVRDDVAAREASKTEVAIRVDYQPPPRSDDYIVNVPVGRTFTVELGDLADTAY